jgi:hypothetical protein
MALLDEGKTPEEAEKIGFHGKDLTGWYGLNPHSVVKLEGEKKEAALKKMREEFATFWKVENGELVNDGHGPYATTEEEFGDIEFRIEYKTVAGADSGIYLRGVPQVQIWDKNQVFDPAKPTRRPHLGSGGLFNNTPDTPGRDPLVVADKPFGEWNSFRIVMDWPCLRVWTNGEVVQDLDVETIPELAARLRKGYLGFESLSYPIRFRNLRVAELHSRVAWSSLYEGPADLAKWHVSDGKPQFAALGPVLYSDGVGHMATNENFRDFELQMYVRHALHHNGGVLFRTAGKGSSARHYEIQLHDVEGAHYPTGSLYSVKRGLYPRIQHDQWWLFQLRVKDATCRVRINGETVLEHDRLENLEDGPIELQAHDLGRYTEYKQIQVRRI